MDKILIAGANGKIGSYLFEKLSKKYKVEALGRNCNPNNKNMYAINLLIEEDVLSFAKIYKGCDILIFLVGLAHKKGRGKELYDFRQSNKQTLVNLLSAFQKFKKSPKKLIFFSTISVYGQRLSDHNYYENHVVSPFSPYAITKLEAEDYLLKNYKNKLYILRLSPVYSNNFLLNIERRIKFSKINYRVGKGQNKISMCNMENIIFVIKGILDDKAPTDTYNISDKITYSYKDLHSWYKTGFPIPIPVFIIKILYFFGCTINNVFLRENMAKLVSSNLFPSKKIQQYIDLPKTLNDCEHI